MAKTTKPIPEDNVTTIRFAYELEDTSNQRLEHHNRIITILTFAMPSIAVIAVTLMLLWSELINQKEKFALGLRESILGTSSDTVSITNPHYLSTDKNNRPVTFSAEFAKETSPGSQIIEITKPKGSIILASGSKVKMEATSGLFYREQNNASFTGDVRAYTDSNNILTTESVNFDMNTKVLSSDSPVSGKFDGGTISSQGLITENSGDIIKFTGKAKLTLTSKPKTPSKTKTSKSKPRSSAKNKNKEK